MIKSRINQNPSAREQLFGMFNFNITPFVTPGTRILVCEKPENRATYGPYVSYGCFIGRSPLQYRCFKCYMVITKSWRASGTVDFFPHHFDMPKTSSADVAAITASQLIHALENPTPTLPFKFEETSLAFRLMIKSRINQNPSAREQLFGMFNFNITPFVTPGTRILVCEKPENRATYGPYVSYGCFIGRSPLQYRCFKCYMVITKSWRASGTVDFFPHHFDMPKTSSADVAAITASQLIHALENPTPALPFKFEETSLAVIKKLSEDFKCAVQPPETQWSQQGNQFQRVGNWPTSFEGDLIDPTSSEGGN